MGYVGIMLLQTTKACLYSRSSSTNVGCAAHFYGDAANRPAMDSRVFALIQCGELRYHQRRYTVRVMVDVEQLFRPPKGSSVIGVLSPLNELIDPV